MNKRKNVLSAKNSSSGICSGGIYTPTPGDVRMLRVSIIPPSGPADLLSPDERISAVAFAMVADSIQGVGKDSLIQSNGVVAFSADQSMGNKRLTNLATPIAMTDAATKDYVDSKAGGGGGSLTSITAGPGLTGGTITSSGTIGLNTELTGLSTLSTVGFLKRTASGVYSAANFLSLASDVTDVLPLSKGGTNAHLTANSGGVVYSSNSALAITASGTMGQVLTSNGPDAPTWTPVNDSTKVFKSGDTMTGLLVLSRDPQLVMEAATKQYVDTGLSSKQVSLGYNPVNRAGDSMTGGLTLPPNGLTVGSNQLVVSGGNIVTNGRVGIGITSPEGPLDVSGGTLLSGHAAPINLFGQSSSSGLGGDLILMAGSGSDNKDLASADGRVRIGGHLGSVGGVASLTACVGGSIVGNDTRGTVTFSTASGTCTIQFSGLYRSAPFCVVSWKGAPTGSNMVLSVSNTTVANFTV